MTTSDLEMLAEMGFEKERAELALKKSGGLQGAIEWLEKHQDKSWDEIKESENKPIAEAAGEISDEQARSLVCNECGKSFRGTAEAEFHASKTEHTDFSQSTEEIKPLTEEEKKERLAELREKLVAKKSMQSEQDKMDKKKNEEIRRKATRESSDIKEDLQKKERIKEAQAKRREKLEDIEARKRVQAKIEADKAERRRKAEAEKAAREGVAPPAPSADLPITTSSGPPASKLASAYAETRLRLQTPNGTIQKSFPIETTLFEVAHYVHDQQGFQVSSFTQNFPKKVFDQEDFGQTLKEVGMVPSAALIIK